MRLQINDLYVDKVINWNKWIKDPYYHMTDKEQDEVVLCTKLEHLELPFESDLEYVVYENLRFTEDFSKLF